MAYKSLSDKKVRLEVFFKYKGNCSYCGCKISLDNFHIDHIKPLKRNMSNCEKGENEIENYNPSCVSCNCSKASMSLDVWRKELSKKLLRLERDSTTYRLVKRFGMVTENIKPVTFYFENI